MSRGVILLFLLISACTRFPELEPWNDGFEGGPYPDLLPLAELLGTEGQATSPDVQAYIESRVGALRRNAARLRGEVIETPARQRMQEGVS